MRSEQDLLNLLVERNLVQNGGFEIAEFRIGVVGVVPEAEEAELLAAEEVESSELGLAELVGGGIGEGDGEVGEEEALDVSGEEEDEDESRDVVNAQNLYLPLPSTRLESELSFFPPAPVVVGRPSSSFISDQESNFPI